MNNTSIIRRACEELMNRGMELNQASLTQQIASHDSTEGRISAPELTEWCRINLDLEYLRAMITTSDWEEIALHGPQCGQFTHREGVEAFDLGPWDKDDYQMCLEILAYRQGMAWNLQHPFASFHLPLQGKLVRTTLIHACMLPMQTSKLFLRCPPQFSVSLNNFHSSIQIAPLFLRLMREKANIIIAGPTGSGKTTLMRALMNMIPKDEHVVTVEDTMELEQCLQFKTGMVAQGDAERLRQFMAWSMRLSPKRIILGEIRSMEIVPFFLALNTGHRGLLTTVHANSAQEVPERLALLYGLYQGQHAPPWKGLMQMICRGIQWIVYVEHKRIVKIIELHGSDGNVPFYDEWSESISDSGEPSSAIEKRQ